MGDVNDTVIRVMSMLLLCGGCQCRYYVGDVNAAIMWGMSMPLLCGDVNDTVIWVMSMLCNMVDVKAIVIWGLSKPLLYGDCQSHCYMGTVKAIVIWASVNDTAILKISMSLLYGHLNQVIATVIWNNLSAIVIWGSQVVNATVKWGI